MLGLNPPSYVPEFRGAERIKFFDNDKTSEGKTR